MNVANSPEVSEVEDNVQITASEEKYRDTVQSYAIEDEYVFDSEIATMQVSISGF